MGELGNCRICGKDASVMYPLLSGSPAFCHSHDNPQGAGRFGADFSGPDDFDIPISDAWDVFGPLEGYKQRSKPQKLDRKTFVWTDIRGVKHKLVNIDDQYLSNIINYLARGKGTVGNAKRRKEVINFLKKEQRRRNSGLKKAVQRLISRLGDSYGVRVEG